METASSTVEGVAYEIACKEALQFWAKAADVRALSLKDAAAG
jgi:hypothetical protein